MKRFGYLQDHLLWVCCALYAINRWGIKPYVDSSFLRNYFNDTLLIPCALPLLLMAQRWMGLRGDDGMPRGSEIALYLIVWSALFEWAGPGIVARATGDWLDMVAYAAGGILAGIWWNREKLMGWRKCDEL